MESGNSGENTQRKIYFVNEQLKELHSKLSYDIQSRIPLENLALLANILVNDANIFEIVKKLLECQNSTEIILKRQRDEQILANQQEIEEYTRTISEAELSHTIKLARLQHEKKLMEIDQSIILQLDASVNEQQHTLASLDIPGFYETTEPKAITTQMHLVNFILKIQKMVELQKKNGNFI